MSEENNGVSNTPSQDVSDASLETQDTAVSDSSNQSIKYHTHKKLLGQHKNALSTIDSLSEEVNRLKQEKLEAEGNKDKLIESLRKEAMETKTKLQQTIGSVARCQAMSAIVEEASKAGCNSPDILKKYVEDQIQGLEFDSDFNPDREQVRALIDEARSVAPILFSKSAPAIGSHSVNTAGGTVKPKPNLKNLSMDQLAEVWAKAESEG